MEVHHHSHTSRTRWTHYFWEFFMLFLAVSLGFFVENQREHMVEHKREKQYIKSMIVDLSADTTKLSSIYRSNTRIIQRIDSILLGYAEFATGSYSPIFFRHERALRGFDDFIYTDRTINQLKSSGGMRLIRKQAASDSIIMYDDKARDYLIEQEGTSHVLRNMTDQYLQLFNSRHFRELANDSLRKLDHTNIDLLLTHDKQKVEGFYNIIEMYQSALGARKNEIIALKNKATRLIAFLKEQYHLN